MKILKYKNKYFDDVLTIYNQLFPRLSDEQLDFEININPFSELYLIGKNENIVGFVQYYDQQDNYEIAYIGVLKKYQRQKRFFGMGQWGSLKYRVFQMEQDRLLLL